jgi:hypothetical protein
MSPARPWSRSRQSRARAAASGRAYLQVIEDAGARTLTGVAQATIAAGSDVRTDAWNGYRGPRARRLRPSAAQAAQGRRHRRLAALTRTSCSPTSSAGRIDIFHGVRAAHMQAYLDEFCYRLNRREQRHDIFRRVLNRCLLFTGPAPYRFLTAT